MQYKTFTNLLQTDADLHKLCSRLEQFKQINDFVAANLEPSLAQQCRVANLRDGLLILSTTSPAWNHKLRFATLDLLSALRANPKWSGLKSIEVRVDYLPGHEDYTTTNFAAAPAKAPLLKAREHFFRELRELIQPHLKEPKPQS